MVPTAIDHHALLRPVLHLLKRKRIADHIAGQMAAALRIVGTNNGVKNHGASVHFVTAELDGGPILIQGHVPVEPHDTPETLAQRVHTVERQIYPQAIAWFAKGRLRLSDGQAMLDNTPIDY
jgi:folate-dependent phosphoribosylglycinamide formyltransferase PurN